MHRLCLIVIDGFGVAPPGPGNARTLAHMPTLDRLEREVPHVIMQASGNAVGLPEGQQGASEPGHLTMGAGRIVWQPLEEITQAVKSGDFFHNAALTGACRRAKERGTTLHVIGLYSSGGVHSSSAHFHAMIELAKREGVDKVMLHFFADGRDKPEQYFCTDFSLLVEEVSKKKVGIIASLVGRYFAMDRDRQYTDRTKVAYDLLTAGVGETVADLCEGAKAWYVHAPNHEKTDYYIRPLKTPAFSAIDGDDTVVCINFRSDRMTQIVTALESEDFCEFPRPVRVKDVVCMGPYSTHLPVAFPPADVPNTLGDVVAQAGGKQLRITETDKFAHVTFFFNAQRQEPYIGEDRVMIESPKVSNFALQPHMSAVKLTEEVLKRAEQGIYDFIVLNYPNPDLVGHGGNLPAAIVACETVDAELGKLLPKLEALGYDWIVTSDHGNAECMFLENGSTINPSHTTSPVQTFVKSSRITAEDLKRCTGLKDIAPLALRIMDLPIPEEMKTPSA